MGDFNARCSRGWRNNITSSTGQEIHSLTSLARYKQVVDKLTHVVNNSLSCIDLIICTKKNVISKHGIDVSIFDKCYHNTICGKINIRVLLPPLLYLFVMSGIPAKQMLKITPS